MGEYVLGHEAEAFLVEVIRHLQVGSAGSTELVGAAVRLLHLTVAAQAAGKRVVITDPEGVPEQEIDLDLRIVRPIDTGTPLPVPPRATVTPASGPVADTRLRILDLCSELARVAVSIPPTLSVHRTNRRIVMFTETLLRTLPKCDVATCVRPATHQDPRPDDLGWPGMVCDKHHVNHALAQARWVELPYAAPVRELTMLLKGSTP